MTKQTISFDEKAGNSTAKVKTFGRPELKSGIVAGSFGIVAGILALAFTGATAESPAETGNAVRLSPLAASDLEAALQTISPDQLEQVRKDVANCKSALFMMDVGPMPGSKDKASGFVQVRVGNYISPRFAIGRSITHFAVPHPIPEAKVVLEGTATVIGSARSVRVSFSPPVDYPTLSGAVTQPVLFDLPQTCGTDQGTQAG